MELSTELNKNVKSIDVIQNLANGQLFNAHPPHHRLLNICYLNINVSYNEITEKYVRCQTKLKIKPQKNKNRKCSR